MTQKKKQNPAGNSELSFQELIFELQKYWSTQECVIVQPYDIEMGAGTFPPATFLRAIGPEPWRTAYAQASRRPTDGRFGENPNRLQHYYQFQVILKPSPDNIQELYLTSLGAIGIDVKKPSKDTVPLVFSGLFKSVAPLAETVVNAPVDAEFAPIAVPSTAPPSISTASRFAVPSM